PKDNCDGTSSDDGKKQAAALSKTGSKKQNRLITLTSGIKEISFIPKVSINAPKHKIIQVLKIIKEQVEKSTRERVYLKDLIPILFERKLIKPSFNKDPRKFLSSKYMATLKLTTIMEKSGFIEISDKPRNKFITITESGKDAIKIFLDYELKQSDFIGREDWSIEKWICYLEGNGSKKLA
ncbi:MAG: DUF6293 family protein, partial [Promethearchaeota archaeon]